MGIRVHKAVGYGVRGVTFAPDLLDRLNNLSENNPSPPDFMSWIRDHEAEIKAASGTRYSRHPEHDPWKMDCFLLEEQVKNLPVETLSMGQFVHHDAEFGLSDAILFCPDPKEGSRYDDYIDWVEETQLWSEEQAKGGSEDGACRWVALTAHSKGLYPWENDGSPPLVVVSLCLWLGLQDLVPKLQPTLYVWWS